jgi:DNA-binding XRE family transcriptional regulator
MNKAKQRRLEQAGWKVGSAKELLKLTPDEAAYIEMRLALSQNFRTLRTRKRMTQVQAAKVLGSSQSRVAKLEAGDPSVSLDLLVRSNLALGASKKDLAKTLS